MSENRKDFSVSASLTVEQKREQERNLIVDKVRRENVESMMRYRDAEIEKREKKLADERKKIADDILTKKNQPTPVLVPKGVVGMSPEQKRQIVENAVNNHYGPEHREQVHELRKSLNQNIDREIRSAQRADQSADRVQTMDTQKPERTRMQSKKQQFADNAHDITANHDQSVNLKIKR